MQKLIEEHEKKMKLWEDYALRCGLTDPQVKHVSKGFSFFGEDKKLLVIRWRQDKCHPGFYEISECAFQNRIRLLSQKNISWDDYEDYIFSWCRSNVIVFDKIKVFDFVWEFFIRKNDIFFSSNYDPYEIYPTLDKENSKRLVCAFDFLEKIKVRNLSIYDMWNSKLSDIIFKYNYWMSSLL